MDAPNIVAKAVYFIEGDENAYEYQSMVISHDGFLWLIATWLESNATGKRFPNRIVPLEKFDPLLKPEGMYRLSALIPKELLSAQCPHELLHKFGAVTHPELAHIPGPPSTH